jgi:hypothetical protein
MLEVLTLEEEATDFHVTRTVLVPNIHGISKFLAITQAPFLGAWDQSWVSVIPSLLYSTNMERFFKYNMLNIVVQCKIMKHI